MQVLLKLATRCVGFTTNCCLADTLLLLPPPPPKKKTIINCIVIVLAITDSPVLRTLCQSLSKTIINCIRHNSFCHYRQPTNKTLLESSTKTIINYCISIVIVLAITDTLLLTTLGHSSTNYYKPCYCKPGMIVILQKHYAVPNIIVTTHALELCIVQ